MKNLKFINGTPYVGYKPLFKVPGLKESYYPHGSKLYKLVKSLRGGETLKPVCFSELVGAQRQALVWD